MSVTHTTPAQVAHSNTLRSLLAGLIVLGYNYIVKYYLDLAKNPAELAEADQVLEEFTAKFPEGAIVLLYKGRHHMIRYGKK